MSSVSQFPHFLPVPNRLFILSNKHIRLQFKHSFNIPFTPSNPFTCLLSPGTSNNPTSVSTSWKFLRQITPLTSHTSHQMPIKWNPNHTLCFSDGSKSKYKSAYAYWIDGSLISHRVRNMASVFTAELIAIFSCLSQLTQLLPHGRFLLLTDSLLSTLFQIPSIQIPFTQSTPESPSGFRDTCFPEHDAVDKAAKQATSFPKITYFSRLPGLRSQKSLLLTHPSMVELILENPNPK